MFEENGFPITWILENDPLTKTLSMSFESALFSADFIQNCAFDALPTGEGLKIYVAIEGSDSFTINSFDIEALPPTPAPTMPKSTAQLKKEEDDANWILANQRGVEPGGVEFCVQEWRPLKVLVGYPMVFTCNGHDILWLSYQVHVQHVHQGSLTALNDHFAVVVTAGDECLHPSPNVHEAPTQADCHNFEEMQAVEGEKCIRRNIAVNTKGSNQTCFIVYCTNHRSPCELWARSFWKKCW